MILRTSFFIPVLLAISFSFADTCTPARKKTPEPGPNDVVYEVQTIFPRFEERIRTAEGKGVFSASERLLIKAETSGTLAKVMVNEGDYIKMGDVLCEFRNEFLQSQVDQKRTEVTEAQTKLDADQKELARLNAAPVQEQPETPENVFLDEDRLDAPSSVTDGKTNPDLKIQPQFVKTDLEARIRTAETNLQKLNEELQILEVDVAKLTLKAPIGGLIQKKNVSDGSLVALGETLFDVVSLDPITLTFQIPEDVGSYVDKLVQVIASPLSAPELALDGSLFFISPAVNPQTQTLEVKGNFANTQNLIREGQEGTATITTRKVEKILVIPKTALSQNTPRPSIFVALGSRVQKTPVIVGNPIGENEVEIKANLRIDDPIILSAPAELEDGSFIKIINKKQSVESIGEVSSSQGLR